MQRLSDFVLHFLFSSGRLRRVQTVKGGGFRRCSLSGDVKHLGRKGLIFLGFLELFFHFQHFLVIFSTPFPFPSSAGGLELFSGDEVLFFRRRELLLKVGGSFSSSFCDFFMLQLHFSSSFSFLLFKLGQPPKGRFRRVLDGGRQQWSSSLRYGTP